MNRDELAEIARRVPPTPVRTEEPESRTHGGWLGRCVGNTMGKPVEGLTASVIRRYLEAVGAWPLRGCVPLVNPLPAGVDLLSRDAWFSSLGTFEDVPRDDDIDLDDHWTQRPGAVGRRPEDGRPRRALASNGCRTCRSTRRSGSPTGTW